MRYAQIEPERGFFLGLPRVQARMSHASDWTGACAEDAVGARFPILICLKDAHDDSPDQVTAGDGSGSFLQPCRAEQHDRLRFELSIRTPCAHDGLDHPWE